MIIKNTLPILFIFITAFFIAIIPSVSALSVNLTMPDDAYSSPSKNVTFGCNVTDENLTNITFFLWDSGNNTYYTDTVDITGTFNETNWTVNDTVPGDYHWNCLAYDNESNSAWSAGNRSLHVNLFYLFESSAESDNTRAIALGDLDGDGDLDYIAGNAGEVNRVYINNGTGNFTLLQSSAEMDDTFAIAIADLDNDGDEDYIAGNYFGQQNKIYLNNGTGNFSLHEVVSVTGGDDTNSIAIADFDNDGDLDFVTAITSGSHDLRIYTNDGTAHFTSRENITSNNFYTVAAGDINGDGYPDIVAGGVDPQPTRIYLNNGTGYFTTSSQLSGPSNFYTFSIALADLDNDGDADLIEGNGNTVGNQVNRVFLNNGTGNFTIFQSIGDTDTRKILLGDYNNDGYLDMVENNKEESSYMLINNGSGHFTVFETLHNSNTFSVSTGDIDDDGDLDYLVANFLSETNKVYKNTKDDSNYIKVYVEGRGTSVNRDGIGTKLELADTAGNLLASRDVSSSSAHGGTTETHFGASGGITYTLNATFITNKVVSCTLQSPKSFRFYENGSSTDGVSCHLVDFPPEIIHMKPPSGNVSMAGDVNFSCNVSDDNMLTSIRISVWNSTNSLYNESMRSVSGTTNFTYLFSQSMTPDTYRWNCRVCDNASHCVTQPGNYTLSVLMTSRFNVKLVMDDVSGKVYIPGKGEMDSGTVDYHYGKPPHFYLASYLNNVVAALVFNGRIPRLVDTGSGDGTHYISVEQDIQGSQIFLAFTWGDWRIIEKRITAVEAGSFNQNPLPSFSYGLGKNYITEIALGYTTIALSGFLKAERGSSNIVIENIGTSSGNPSILIKKS